MSLSAKHKADVPIHNTSEGASDPSNQSPDFAKFLHLPLRIRVNKQLALITEEFANLLQRLCNDGDISTSKIKPKHTAAPIAFHLLLIGGVKTLLKNPEEFWKICVNKTSFLNENQKQSVKTSNVEAALRGFARHYRRVNFLELKLACIGQRSKDNFKRIVTIPNRHNLFFEDLALDFVKALHKLAIDKKFVSRHLPKKKTYYFPTKNIIYQLILIFGVDSIIENPRWFATQCIHFTNWLNNDEKLKCDMLAVQGVLEQVGNKHLHLDTRQIVIYNPSKFKAKKMTPEMWEKIKHLILRGEGSVAIAKQVKKNITRQTIDYYKNKLKNKPDYSPNFSE